MRLNKVLLSSSYWLFFDQQKEECFSNLQVMDATPLLQDEPQPLLTFQQHIMLQMSRKEPTFERLL
jgi:hypothetical protein